MHNLNADSKIDIEENDGKHLEDEVTESGFLFQNKKMKEFVKQAK
jgi:hypothetical protein